MTEETGPVTLGEIYRLQLKHGEKLDAIEGQTRLTNGRVTRLEGRADGVDREVRDLKRGVPRVVEAPKAGAISVSIPMDVKTLVIVITAAGAILLAALSGFKVPIG